MPARPTPITRALLVTAGFACCAVGGAIVAVPHHGVARTLGSGASTLLPSDTSSGSSPSQPPDPLPQPSPTGPPSSSAPTSSTVDVGALPQTDARPTTSSQAFKEHSRALWQAVVDDNPDVALGFFFPLTAYRQVKAISDPDGDYNSRLIANFRTDVHNLHAQLGAVGTTATFTGLSVPGAQEQWIVPGVEYNKGSYWRVFGSSLDYTVDGVAHSLPVVSLISWRGEWYVVHLGPIR